MSDTAQWLQQLGLGKYVQIFTENDITLRVIPDLSEEDLKELGLSLGHRRVLQGAIAEQTFPNQSIQSGSADTASATAAEAERRQLTVMFCDLVGSTELSQRLDPEVLSTINRAFQERCSKAIQACEGYVARYMGDGLLSYFGYPVAHEDAVERAIRAGLDVVAAMDELNSSIGQDNHARLAVRVGIATGPVVVGDLVGEGAAQESTVVGETPNLAARLQAATAPDTVAIALKTKQLAGDLFEYINAGEFALKGIAAPIPLWTVKGEAVVGSRFDAMRASKLTPMVGRDQEIALLFDRWEQVKEGDGQVILLCGEAGIGKSRVVQTVGKQIAADKPIRLRYQCSAYHTSSALRPVIAQLEWAARIDHDDQADARLDKLESLLMQTTADVTAIMPLFASLLSIPYSHRYTALSMAPEQQKESTLDALVAQMKGLAEQQPVLMIFEDTHWADPTSLEFLRLIIEESQGNRVLALITFRPDFTPPWTGYTHITALTLNRFSRSRVLAMMNQVTAGKPLPLEVQDQIIEKTDGIPLFVEELTKTVVESDLLQDRHGHYVLTGPLPALAIPSTLQDSLMARLDRIGAVKETAQIAAVIGREFTYGLLSRVSSLPENELSAALEQLKNAALVFAKGTPPLARYVFKHAMVQDAAYESLLKSRRRRLHAEVARALETEPAEHEPELLAYHFNEAGLYEPAADYWLKAGQRALERSANIEAMTHLHKGLELIQVLPESADSRLLELNLQLALGPALMAIKGYAAPEIEQVYARARELCREFEESMQLFAATWGLWLYYQQGGQLSKARDLTEEVLNVAKQQSNPALMLQAHHAAWATFHRLGELELCRHHAEHGVALYDMKQHGNHAYLYGGHDPGECAEIHVALALWCLGYPEQALQRALKGLALSERLSHPFSHVDGLFGVIRIHLFRQEYVLAEALAQEMIALSKEHGFSVLETFGTIMQGFALAKTGQTNDRINEMRRCLDITQDSGTQAHLPYLISLLIDVCLQTGKQLEGLQAVADAQQIVENTGERNWQAEICRLQGELLLLKPQARQSEAEQCFQRALDIAAGQKARSLQLRAAMSLARLWRSRARPGDARELLLSNYDNFSEGFDTLDLKAAKSLINDFDS